MRQKTGCGQEIKNVEQIINCFVADNLRMINFAKIDMKDVLE